jgi:hypothetical protein
MVLALQRAIGNSAVTSLLTRRKQDQAAGESRDPGGSDLSPLPGVIQRQQSPTRRELRREAHLRRLAVWPREALGEWRRLNSGEQTFVVMSMLSRYGERFAREFLAHARRRRRSEPTVHVTNVPSPSPRQLEGRGYQRVGIINDVEKWVHPSGDEYWFLPSARQEQQQQQPSSASSAGQGRTTGGTDIENPPRIDPSVDPETVYGPERRSRPGAHVMGQHGYAAQYQDGTIVLFRDGSTAPQTYRPRPGGGYDFYDENGEKTENVVIVIDPDEVFGSPGGAAP